jgi:hypothetical protein
MHYAPAFHFFDVLNVQTEREKFLADSDYVPVFVYGDHFNIAAVQELVNNAPNTYKSKLELVLAGALLQENPSEQNVNNFRRWNTVHFGEPHSAYTKLLLKKISLHAASKGGKAAVLWQQVEEQLSLDVESIVSETDFAPSHELFLSIRGYFKQYAPWLFVADHQDLENLMKVGLEESGLVAAGWNLTITDDDSSASVMRHNKTIKFGANYKPRTPKSARRIVAHEIYGHAIVERRNSLAESEGFAVLLEQLMDAQFTYRRSFRFLACALGWGIDGKPLDFRQVYEILWRCIAITSKYSEVESQTVAFNECVRVFRGGRPDIAGAVYLKDAVYLEGNIAVWQALAKKDISYSDFTDIIEGRRKLL